MTRTGAIFILLAGGAVAQTVEGNLVKFDNGAGIAGVTTILQPLCRPDCEDKAYTASSDALGHFLFAGVKAGTYRFFYNSPEWYPADAESFFRTIKVTTSVNDPVKLQVRMKAMPVISGRVVDRDGNGVTGARVDFIQSSMLPAFFITDAAGRFEAHLGPGNHILSAAPPASLKPPDPEPGSNQARVWARTWYPGAAMLEAAAKIAIQPGDVSRIEMKLAAVPAHVIRGTLVNPDGTPAPDVPVALNDDEPRLGPDNWSRPTYQTRTNSAGSFEFPPVANGDWRIAAELQSGGVKLHALEWVELAGHDVENVKLRLAAPFALHGRVVMEAPQGSAVAKTPSVSLIPHEGRVRMASGTASWILQPDMANAGSRAVLFELDGAIAADADQDGNIGFRDVYAGSYRIVPAAPPPGYYLDSVRVGDADVGGGEVLFSSGGLPITVTYKTNGGAVRGTVEKCESGTVLLIPQDADMRWFGFLHAGQCDANDHYEIGAVRPGKYYAVAFSQGGPPASLDDNVVLQARGITVSAGEVATADLSPIRE